MSFDFKNKSLILRFLERWVFENFLVIIRTFVINKRLKGKCQKLWKNEKILDLRVVNRQDQTRQSATTTKIKVALSSQSCNIHYPVRWRISHYINLNNICKVVSSQKVSVKRVSSPSHPFSNIIRTRSPLPCRLRVVPHFPSGIVERTKLERAWKSPHARKGDTRWGERKIGNLR